jgi:hypothetical protein
MECKELYAWENTFVCNIIHKNPTYIFLQDYIPVGILYFPTEFLFCKIYVYHHSPKVLFKNQQNMLWP